VTGTRNQAGLKTHLDLPMTSTRNCHSSATDSRPEYASN